MLTYMPPAMAMDPAAALDDSALSWQPVEVKCVCPWQESGGKAPRKKGKGKGKGRRAMFSLNSSPPHGPTIPVHAAIQVQLQMLATRTREATMLSYTALHGMHVLRVERDDVWCGLMLRTIRSMYAAFVQQPDAWIPANPFYGV